MVHRIRLHAVWHRGTTLGQADGPRIQLPDNSPPAADSLWYWRTFNAPTGIDIDTPLEVVVERWQGMMTVSFDGARCVEKLAYEQTPCVIDLTGRITAAHQVTIHLAGDRDSLLPRLNGTVELWISV